MGLRTDFRQWLIYDESTVTAVVRALEVLALGIVGRSLQSHRVMAVRAIGHFMSKVAETRTRQMVMDERTHDAMAATVKVAGFLSGQGPEPAELDDLYAAVFWLDSRVEQAGTDGDGWYRKLVTG